MSRYVLKAVGSRKVRAIALTVLALTAGWAAAQQAARSLAERRSRRTVSARETSLSQPSAWLTRSAALEIDLDLVVTEAESYRGVVFDRDALTVLVEDVVGVRDGVEEMRLVDLLDEIPRVRLSKGGRSIVLGRLTLRRLLGRALGGGTTIQDATLGDLLDVLSGVEVTATDIPERLDARSLSTVLREAFKRQPRMDHSRDPGFRERVALELRYLQVVRVVKAVRRAGYGTDGDSGFVYDEAYTALIAAGRSDDIPLLDAHMQLEEELDGADMSHMSLAERIAFRWEARRWAFGEELASVLFSRKEAMERYDIDRLAIEEDDYSAPQDKARWLRDRRTALKVELAAQGAYVGFPDEAAPPVSSPAPSAVQDESDAGESDANERAPRQRRRR